LHGGWLHDGRSPNPSRGQDLSRVQRIQRQVTCCRQLMAPYSGTITAYPHFVHSKMRPARCPSPGTLGAKSIGAWHWGQERRSVSLTEWRGPGWLSVTSVPCMPLGPMINDPYTGAYVRYTTYVCERQIRPLTFSKPATRDRNRPVPIFNFQELAPAPWLGLGVVAVPTQNAVTICTANA
jgi:hypothetical protein